MAGSSNSRFFQWGPREAAVLPLILTLEGAMTMDQAVEVSWPTTWIVFLPQEGRRGRLRGTWLTGLPELVEVGAACFDHIDSQIAPAQTDAAESASAQEFQKQT